MSPLFESLLSVCSSFRGASPRPCCFKAGYRWPEALTKWAPLPLIQLFWILLRVTPPTHLCGRLRVKVQVDLLVLSLPRPLISWKTSRLPVHMCRCFSVVTIFLLISYALIHRTPPPSSPQLCFALTSTVSVRYLASVTSHSSCIRAATLRTNWGLFSKPASSSAVKCITATSLMLLTGESVQLQRLTDWDMTHVTCMEGD